MAPISEIRAHNASFAAQNQASDVCVFVGATGGIGEHTLAVMVASLVAPTVYVVGRSASRWETQYQRLREANGEAEFIFVEAEVSTIRGVDEACKKIMATTTRIDYLFMSMGYFPLVGAIGMCRLIIFLTQSNQYPLMNTETPEGLEQCYTLSCWARIRFLYNLLEALKQSPHPRVLSVLSGGHEGTLLEDDLGLENNWSIPNFGHQTSTVMTLGLYHFAPQAPSLTLIHSWPGFVRTDKSRKPKPDASAPFLWRWSFSALRGLMSFVALFRGISVEESAQRHAFLLTSNKITPGVWRFNEFSEAAPRNEQLERLLEEGKTDKVWDFTVATWDKALKHGSNEEAGRLRNITVGPSQ